MEKDLKINYEKALDVLTSKDNKLAVNINACVRCGLCADSCMYYKALKHSDYIPGKKVELVGSLYKRYSSFTGRVAPYLFGAKVLDEKSASQMVDLLFGACTMCGRCVKHCSIGVDIPYVVRKGREMLVAMNMVPQTLQATVDAAVQTGNNMGIPEDEFTDTIRWMEDELRDELSDEKAEIPLNEVNRDIFYTLNPREPKFFPLSISAMAKIFYAAKESWTLSTKYYDVTNYGFFNANNHEAAIITRNLHDEVKRLGCKRLVLGECGHGSRANRWEGPNYLKKQYDFDVTTVVELIAEYIQSGKIKIDKSLNSQKYTIHDPCNLVRNGGLLKQIRFVVNESVSELVEMNPYGNDNFCCGGGGGQLAMSEYNERRIAIGKIKADQIKATGAKVVITPCHNCVDQLSQLNHTYKLGVQIKTIAEVVADALIINN